MVASFLDDIPPSDQITGDESKKLSSSLDISKVVALCRCCTFGDWDMSIPGEMILVIGIKDKT